MAVKKTFEESYDLAKNSKNHYAQLGTVAVHWRIVTVGSSKEEDTNIFYIRDAYTRFGT